MSNKPENFQRVLSTNVNKPSQFETSPKKSFSELKNKISLLQSSQTNADGLPYLPDSVTQQTASQTKSAKRNYLSNSRNDLSGFPKFDDRRSQWYMQGLAHFSSRNSKDDFKP